MKSRRETKLAKKGGQNHIHIWKLNKGGGLAGDKGENQEGENNKLQMCWLSQERVEK